MVAAPGSLTVTDRIDVLLSHLPGNEHPLESGARVHVDHGTSEVLGRVLLMDDRPELEPGQRAYAQVRLEQPLAPRYGDRFILRSYSPVLTIGGGVVLDALPPRRTHLKDAERELLDALANHDLTGAATGLVASRGTPMSSAEVAAALGLERAGVADDLNRSGLERLKAGGETYYVTADAFERLLSVTVGELLAFHASHPMATGVAAGALRDLVDRRVAPRVFDAVLDTAASRGLVRLVGGQVRHPQAAAAALAEEDAALAALGPLLREQGLAPAGVTDLASAAGVDAAVARKALGKLAAAGQVVRLGPDLHFAAEAVDDARARIVAFLADHPTMLAKEARDVLGTSRKYAVPLLEHFDAEGVTKREGDVRTLRAK